jgi:LacI family transcriptional regulator
VPSRSAAAKAGRRPTIRDVAARAGVSKSTVSRILNGKPDVDPETVASVMTVVEQLGYVPSSPAVSLARGRARTIGLLAPALSRPWVLEVLRGVAEGIETTDYSLSLFTSSRSQSSMQDLLMRLRSQAIDGLAIMQPPWRMDVMQDFYAHGVPVVLIDDRETHPDVPSIATADREGVRQAVSHFVSLGRTRVAMISGPVEIGCHRDRLTAFRDALDECSVTTREGLICEAFEDSYSAGMQAATKLLRRGERFDALFVGNDAMALGALRVLRAEGLAIPGDVAICGFDDVAAARYADPPLTTIYNPLYEMGGRAVHLLLEACEGKPLPHEPVMLPTRLVIRASTTGYGEPEVVDDSDLVTWSDTQSPVSQPRSHPVTHRSAPR